MTVVTPRLRLRRFSSDSPLARARGEIIRMNEVHGVGADEFVGRVAEDALDRCADEGDDVVLIGDGCVFAGELHDALEACLIAPARTPAPSSEWEIAG